MGSVLRSDVRRSEFLRVVQAAAIGDGDAVNKVVTHCLPQISSYLARRGAAHPEALANQVMAEFVGNLPRLEFKSQERVWSYLYSVARSRLLDEKRVVRLEQPTDCIDGADVRTLSFDDTVVDQMWVTDLLSKLTEDQRRVVELRFREDLTLEETAKRTGKTLTAVKGLQRRALAALAAAAALAAMVIVVLLAVKFLQNPGINIQSLQPAGGSEQNELEADDRSTGAVRTETGTATTEVTRSSGAGGALAGVPNVIGPGFGGGGADNQLPVDDGTGLPTASTTSVPGAPAAPSTTVSQTTSTSAQTGSTAVTTTIPAAVRTIHDDFASFLSSPNAQTWLTIDVLANDIPTADRSTLRITRPFSAGFAEIVTVGGVPMLRYYPTGPGTPVGQYEVCSPQGCELADVTVSVTWYSEAIDYLCSGLQPTITGTPGDDVLVGTAGADIIFGLGGDDRIDGGGGNDILCGGPGDDVISGNDGNDTIVGGAGDDRLSGDEGDDSLYGGSEVDVILGGSGMDQIYGGDGNDVLDGGSQKDAIFGEAGDDLILGGANADTLFGGLGVDRIEGLGGSDLLRGGPGADTLIGGNGEDRLVGNSAEDNMSQGTIIEADGGTTTGGDVGGGGTGTGFPESTTPGNGPSDYYD